MLIFSKPYYNHIKDYSIQEVFENVSLGFIFEFYTSKKSSFIAEDFKNLTGKNVAITEEDILPTWTVSVLLKEYEAPKSRYQFKIVEPNYFSSKVSIYKILEWIRENASLDYSTGLKVFISFDSGKLQTLKNISNMDIDKMVLKMNENFIYSKFPEMKSSPFAISIKNLMIYEGIINNSESLSTLKNLFKMPSEKYYGIDFSEQTRGILGFNYIGEEKYAEKAKEIGELLEYYILTTYQVINTEEYSADMISEADKITTKFRNFKKYYYNSDKFIKENANLKVFVNLKDTPQIIKTYWSYLRNPLLGLITEGSIEKGFFNWDSDEGVFQLKSTKLSGVKLSNFYLIDCEIKGILENCHLWKCKIDKSRIKRSMMVSGNTLNECYINNSRVDKENTINKSYIINSGEIINCKVNKSIIKNAGIGEKCKLDENSVVVSPKKEVSSTTTGIKVEEIRDYKWIKSMNKSEDKGFGNEYKTDY